MKKFRGRRLLAMVMAVLMVIGMMPTDWAATVASAATTFEGGQEVTDGTWAGWTWSVFGEGTGNIGTDNKITDNGSSVTLYSGNNKGKISNNNDVGNYLYRKVDAGSDFIITADVKVDSWTAANQQAWGLITMSAVQNNGYTGKDKYNSSALVGGVQIAGVQYQGHTRLNNTLTGVNSTDISSNADALAVASGEQGKTYKLTIQKTGSKVTLLRNNLIVQEISADSLYAAGDMYVGLFTSRKVQVTFSNVKFDTVAGTTHSTTVTDIKYPTKA